MNERIFEMAIKCGIIVMDQHGEDNSDAVQEFTELIVRECAKVAFYDWYDGTNEGSSKMAILKHFGVEE